MSLIIWLITGGVAGWLASIITSENKSMGIFANVVIGIVGSFIAGTLITSYNVGRLDLTDAISGFNLSSIVISTLGAIVLIVILRAFRRDNTHV